ncbi:hypothetical protein F7D01_13710 [Erythrobacter sp. 3-20A1M]|uniref:hypothetical protein n=1 Tax=Erythrobacter sp. 3-20A1M TaxID=2653850 RepID=UPI001BFCB9A4|nr:hypothetical protein [Erythrobacter sp. 3-20A1M]QWC57978.1 hypothetical protein F7D01_13710 [Erythrobacter sp. 3-20A1M]
MFFQNTTPSRAAVIVMDRLLAALDARDTAREVTLEPIGLKVVFALDRATALIDPDAAQCVPMASLVAIAEDYSLDLLVLREVALGNSSIGICCDAILASHPCDTLTLMALEPWAQGGVLSLVRERGRHAIRVAESGCEIVLGQPFSTPGQMLSGLLRAQSPIAIDMRREERV